MRPGWCRVCCDPVGCRCGRKGLRRSRRGPTGRWGRWAAWSGSGIWNALAVPAGLGSWPWLAGSRSCSRWPPQCRCSALAAGCGGWPAGGRRRRAGAGRGARPAGAAGSGRGGGDEAARRRADPRQPEVRRPPGPGRGGLLRARGRAVLPALPVRWTRPAAAGLVVAPVLLLPALAWGAAGRLAAVDYPPAFAEARAAMAADTGPGRCSSCLAPLPAVRLERRPGSGARPGPALVHPAGGRQRRPGAGRPDDTR